MVEEKKIPDGYWESDVGVIPEQWRSKELGKMLIEKPKYGLNAAAVEFSDNLPAYIRITDINSDGYYTKENKVSVKNEYANQYILENGDIVFARTGASTGKSYLYKSEDGILVYAGFLINIRPNNSELDSKFLKYVCNTHRFWDWVRITSMRSGQPGINGEEYSDFLVQVPSIQEQKAIATALSDTDDLILSLEKLINKKKLIKQGAMQELLTGKKRLDGFSGEWKERTIKDISTIYRGASPRPIEDSRWFDRKSNVGWVRISDITNSNKYLTKTVQKLSKDGISKSRFIDSNSLIMSICATVGRPILTKIDSCIHDGFVVFQNLLLDKEFFYYVLQYKEPNWSKYGQTGSQMNLNTNIIDNENIIFPSHLEEQVAIANILSDMDKEIEKLIIKLDKYKNIKKGMMEELLTGKRRLI